MNRNDGDCIDVQVWWVTIDGCTHLETNPVVIEAFCGWPERSAKGEDDKP